MCVERVREEIWEKDRGAKTKWEEEGLGERERDRERETDNLMRNEICFIQALLFLHFAKQDFCRVEGQFKGGQSAQGKSFS